MWSIVFHGGMDAFIDYLSAHVITCLVPAFFIAGAIGVFVSQASVMKYFGAQAKRVLLSGGVTRMHERPTGDQNSLRLRHPSER